VSAAIHITQTNGERCVYRGDQLIATIVDHRRTNRKVVHTVQGLWMVAWLTGRVDWHDTLALARDNALKGN
jgi:hypothetical protein